MRNKEFFEFGCFRLSLEDYQLLCDGEPVPLEPKVFETLVVLLERGGRLVGKEELMQAVWPDSFVEESNLTRNISVLRKALTRNGGGPQYIETVPKRGYRFVGEVRALPGEQTELTLELAKVSVVVEQEDTEEPLEEAVTKPMAGLASAQSFLRPHGRKLGVILTLLLVAVAAAVYFNFFPGREPAMDSLAVLPFVNVDADPDSEYLSEGITDALINGFSRLPKLKVMSLSSVMRYKGSATDAQQAGTALGVRAVLTGKVTKRGDELLVSAELVNVRDNSHLWGEQYVQKLSGLLDVQSELARDIAQQLRLKLNRETEQRLTKRGTENAEAYDLYLKGRYYLNSLTVEGSNRGFDYFQRAVEIDPQFGRAYAGLADAYSDTASMGATFNLPRGEAYSKAKEAALKAVGLDDTLTEAHVSLGKIAFDYEWDWNSAERELKHAIELDPNYAPAHHGYSHYLIAFGRFDESLAESLRALAIDSLDLGMTFHLGFHYYNARQYGLAVAQLQRALEMNRNHSDAHAILGLVYEQQKRYPEAIAEMQKSVELGGIDNRGPLGHMYAISGQRGTALALIAQLQEEARHRPVSPYHIARIYAGLGDKEQTFAWLEKAFVERDGNLGNPGIKVDQMLESLHTDPRFADLLRRMGIQQ